jgi:hypothetical protein
MKLIAFLGQDFFYEDMESLTQMLRALATDGNKHRAKVDKRKQRSVFRDVLRAVEVGHLNAVIATCFEIELFHAELDIDSWIISLIECHLQSMHFTFLILRPAQGFKQCEEFFFFFFFLDMTYKGILFLGLKQSRAEDIGSVAKHLPSI